MPGPKACISNALRILCAGVVAFAVVPAAAQTLEDALSKAYENNPTLQAERAKLRATDETVSQALSGWRPTVSMSVEGGKRRVAQNHGIPSQVRTPKDATITLDQNLFNGFGTQASVKSAEYNVDSERASLVDTEQSTLLDAATAYMDVVRDQAVLNLDINNEHVLQRQLEATRDRFQVGEVTRTDVAQAESRLSQAHSERIGAEGNLVNSRAEYRNVVGEAPGELKSAKPLGGLPTSEEEAQQLARHNAPTVFAARYSELAANQDVKVVAADLWPSLDIAGAVERSDNATSKDSRTDSASITATVTMPLYQAGDVSAKIRKAKETAGQRRQELDSAVRSAVKEATRSWEALQTARSQIRAYTEQVRAASIALDGVQQEAAVGSRTVLDVLNAEQELLNARVSLVRAQRDEVVATFSLRAAVGGLTAQRLGLPVPIYEYAKHYEAVRNKWWGTAVGPN